MLRLLILFLLLIICSHSRSQINGNSKWVNLKGDSVYPMRPAYGIKGVKRKSNSPGGRSSAAYWTDSVGNIWIFGGLGNGVSSPTNELWKYEVNSNQWTWIGGSNIGTPYGKYGSLGITSSTNLPGGRWGCVAWTDSNGYFYLYGGKGYAGPSSVNFGFLNDLWRYNPATNEWTWLKGDSTLDKPGVYGLKGTASASNRPGARYLSTFWKTAGKIWMFGGFGYSESAKANLNDLWSFDLTTFEWTWVGGNNTAASLGVYGTKGESSAANLPGARYASVGWIDNSGNLWLFGGSGHAATGNGRLNDLWKFDPLSNEWTWMKGTNAVDQVGTYGALGTPSSSNNPGGRHFSSSWKDSLGNFFLFGGNNGISINEVHTAGDPSIYADLWKYNPQTNEWTWIGGSSTLNSPGVYGNRGIANPNNRPGARMYTTVINSNGRVYLSGGSGYTSTSGLTNTSLLNDIWEYNSLTNEWKWINGEDRLLIPPAYGIKAVPDPGNHPGGRSAFASWSDKRGNLWLFGGHGYLKSSYSDLNSDLWLYNPQSNNWTWIGGDTVLYSKSIYGTQGVAAVDSRPGARHSAVSWIDTSGNLWLFGGNGYSSTIEGYLNDLWKFDITTRQWTWIKGDKLPNVKAVYGTQGQASPTNKPGATFGALAWTDKENNLWMYGGDAHTEASVGGVQDLWKYNIATNEWTWVMGNKSINSSPVWGAQGTAAPANTPGMRRRAVAFVDSAGKFWLFGGEGYNSGYGYYNDLWKYDPLTNMWTWMKGDNGRDGAAVYGVKGLSSPSNKPGARSMLAGWSDHKGGLWIFGGEIPGRRNDLWRYDIQTNEWTWVKGDNIRNQYGVYGTQGIADINNNPGARTTTTSWKDSAGNFYLFGGNGLGTYPSSFSQYSLNDVWAFGTAITPSNEIVLCPPTASTSLFSNLPGSIYQWQADTGSGFSNLTDNLYYSGTNTSTLQLVNIPSQFYGYKFRCIVDGNPDISYFLRFANSWTGAIDNTWENPKNWSCNQVPDQYTDVYITSGMSVVLSSNVTVGSLILLTGGSLVVQGGFLLTVLR